MRHGDGCGRFLGICALGLGLGILIAAIFPVGVLMFLVSFLLIACGIVVWKSPRLLRGVLRMLFGIRE